MKSIAVVYMKGGGGGWLLFFIFVVVVVIFFFQAEDGIRDSPVTGVQTCALPISTVAASEIPDAVVNAVKHLFDNKAPDKIGPSPMPGFFQVTFGAQLFYISRDGLYLVAGSIYEVADRKSVV